MCFGKGVSSSMVRICLCGKLNSARRLPGSAPSETCGDLLLFFFSRDGEQKHRKGRKQELRDL